MREGFRARSSAGGCNKRALDVSLSLYVLPETGSNRCCDVTSTGLRGMTGLNFELDRTLLRVSKTGKRYQEGAESQLHSIRESVHDEYQTLS